MASTVALEERRVALAGASVEAGAVAFSSRARAARRRYLRREAEAFERWTPDNERAALVGDQLLWQPDALAPAFDLDVREFFARVADDGLTAPDR